MGKTDFIFLFSQRNDNKFTREEIFRSHRVSIMIIKNFNVFTHVVNWMCCFWGVNFYNVLQRKSVSMVCCLSKLGSRLKPWRIVFFAWHFHINSTPLLFCSLYDSLLTILSNCITTNKSFLHGTKISSVSYLKNLLLCLTEGEGERNQLILYWPITENTTRKSLCVFGNVCQRTFLELFFRKFSMTALFS